MIQTYGAPRRSRKPVAARVAGRAELLDKGAIPVPRRLEQSPAHERA